jgi:hypothetical protein
MVESEKKIERSGSSNGAIENIDFRFWKGMR